MEENEKNMTKKILVKHRSDKGPESIIYNELLQYNNDSINPNNS